MPGSEPGNPAGGTGERDRELGSVELEGNVPPESEWLNCFQTKTRQGGTRLALWIGWEGVGIFSLQGIWVELQQEAQGPDDSFSFQGALKWEMSDLSQMSISFSYFLFKIKSVRQVAGDLLQMESSCTSVLRCYLIQSNAHQ